MRRKTQIVAAVLLSVVASSLFAQEWQTLGPDGGSVRSLTSDPANPDRIFLGTSAGRLYLSEDNGATWLRFARLGNSSEMVLDHIVIDPSNPRWIYVSAWNAQSPNDDGDIYRSRDGGRTWEVLVDMHGKSIRALSMAPSDPKILVAGTLDGIYRTRDRGENWERISPPNHAEIKNVESVAIDPVNPEVIYAGTWHLPWKTDDGGKNWRSIKKGVIDDSDVFSIVIDPLQPANVYITACSGIYRSDTAGDLFRKIQGIPYAARRTRALRMDPSDHNIVYAGTTEGLWKTADAGVTWKRMTGSNVVVNDVLIDPRRPSRVLLATDRGGILASDDGGLSFVQSNRGFVHRQVAALAVDHADPATLYAGVLNDKEYGGVFVSRDAGHSWMQSSDGLDGRDVFVLRQSQAGALVAGTDRGLFQLAPGGSHWLPLNTLTDAARSGVPKPGMSRSPVLNLRVSALELGVHHWFAALPGGLFVSADAGQTWHRETMPGLNDVVSIISADRMIAIAGRQSLIVSVNDGESWLPARPLPPEIFVNSVSIDSTGNIWLAARDGVYRSTDAGDSWKRILSLRLSDVIAIEFDPEDQKILAVGASSANVFESRDSGRTWLPINSGWRMRNVNLMKGRLVGTTLFDGVVIQPETSVSANPAESKNQPVPPTSAIGNKD